MRGGLVLTRAAIWLLAATSVARAATPATLVVAEQAFADMNDASGALGLIDSGFATSYAGGDRSVWERALTGHMRKAREALAKLQDATLAPDDRRAVERMTRQIEALSADSASGLEVQARCEEARSPSLDDETLRRALYACFDEIGNQLEFDGARVSRLSAFELLTTMPDPARRKTLFLAFTPLWKAINGDNDAESPYRRLMRREAARAAREGSGIDAAAKTLGVSAAEVERWLVAILDAWRQANAGAAIEPWDFRYWAGAADRKLADRIPREALQRLNERYFRDLGADLEALGIVYDLDPRPGKAPAAHVTHVRLGRLVDGRWRPSIARVSGNYASGGLSLLGELVHENAHAVHMTALRTRPAFMGLGDSLFVESFAEVPAWDLYTPAWQREYLGFALGERESLLSLHAGLMLDVAWALFELKLLRDPSLDPNRLWTEITHHYLHVVPHPEHSWWAARIQLVLFPGYMVNYGLGAVVTADLRQRIREQLGSVATGNSRWYPWLSEQLLKDGEARPTRDVLTAFLGRPVSPQSLMDDVRRLTAHDGVVH